MSAGGAGRVSLVLQYTDTLRIPSPADVDATTYLATIFNGGIFLLRREDKETELFLILSSTLET